MENKQKEITHTCSHSYSTRRFSGTFMIELEPNTIIDFSDCGNMKNLTTRITRVCQVGNQTLIGINKITNNKDRVSVSETEFAIEHLPVRTFVKINEDGPRSKHHIAYFPQENCATKLGMAGEGIFKDLPKIRR